MAELKTKRTGDDVTDFLNAIPNEAQREDAFTILKLMKGVTKSEPAMWGSSIVGFGTYHYIYKSGREGDWFLTGFSPRKANITLYIMAGFDQYSDLLRKLGKHKSAKSCLYIKSLEDIDLAVLKELIQKSITYLSKKKWK